MPSMKALLAGAALSVLTLAAAQAGEYVEWKDDGTVLLKLGTDYDDAVITASKEDMGALFGPGEKPFEGEEITVLTLDSGPKGGISGPIYAFRPVFEELTGAKLNIALVPISELYTKLFLDLRNGTGEYDGSIVGAFMYGDLIDGKYILPVDEWRESGDYPQWSYDVMPPALKNIYTWGGVGYGVLGDADGQILYYRRDMLTNPEHMAAFKAQYGYDLPAPPATLQQLKDIAAYFHGKNFDTVDGEPDSGAVLHLKVREQGLYHFMTLATSFAVTPGEISRTQGVYWFDPVDMTPLINSPGHVKALEYLKDLAQYGPAAQVSWSLGEAWDYFLRGKAIFNFSYGDVAPLAQDEARSKIRGKIGSAILPASDTYWDMNKKEFVTSKEPRKVGNVTGGSWQGVVSSLSDHPEATYSLLVADGDQAGLEVAGDLWLGRRRPRLQLPVPGAGRRGQARGLHQGRLGRRGRQAIPRRLLPELQRADDAALHAHHRHPGILRHPGFEPVVGDERCEDPAAGARRHGGRLAAGHRPARPRQAAQGLPGSDRLEGLIADCRPAAARGRARSCP